jgi:hypothetical protein
MIITPRKRRVLVPLRNLRYIQTIQTRRNHIVLPLVASRFGPVHWRHELTCDGLLWMANVATNEGKESILDRNIDLSADTLKVMLATATYVANADEDFIDEGGADDAVDGRAAGTTDQTLAGKVFGKDDTGDFAYFDANDSVFSAVPAGSAITQVPWYKSTGVDTTSKLIGNFDIPDVTPNGGDITIQYATPANGGLYKLA